MMINTFFITFTIVLSQFQINGLPLSQNTSPPMRKPYENPDLFEGDMILPYPISPILRGVARRGEDVKWPDGIIPYEILPGYALAQESFIIATMEKMERLIAINNVKCIQFRPKIPSDEYYISITNGHGCSSPVGRNTGVIMNRTVTLQHPGCIDEARVMHELLHSLGFFHEQSRPDRDDNVKIYYENIQAGMEHNFQKYDDSIVDTLGTPYDYASVMHYEKYAFSANGLPTIEPFDSSIPIGQRYNMSTIDIHEVRLFYNCLSSGSTLPPIPTTTTANLYVINTTISSSWTKNNQKYARVNGTSANYYYHEYNIIVPITGYYIFESRSSIDTVGYIYTSSFNPMAPYRNLIASDDDGGDSRQFKLTMHLYADTTYVLVATTSNSYATGSYTIIAAGLHKVSITSNSLKILYSTSMIVFLLFLTYLLK